MPTPKNAHLWERDPHDWYVEPAWAAERLFDVETFVGYLHDPACGIGTIVKAAWNHRRQATGSDLVDRGCPGAEVLDFLHQRPEAGRYDNIVTNPPFKHARQFVELGIAQVSRKAAFLLPLAWLSGDRRSKWLEAMPLERVLVLTPRPSMPPGAVVVAGDSVGQGSTDFAWFIFNRQIERQPPTIGWLRREG